ncbi:hypothetical protein LX32DRAFT_686384, partial [Colletotrichum zoysiae]
MACLLRLALSEAIPACACLALATGALSAVLKDLQATPTRHASRIQRPRGTSRPTITIRPRRKIVEEQRPHGNRNPSHGSVSLDNDTHITRNVCVPGLPV